jgi:hypothetical protein
VKRQTRSILQELETIAVSKDRQHIVESRGQHIIESAVNLINTIRETYDAATAAELERRLINSIKAQDPKKFQRSIRKANENR